MAPNRTRDRESFYERVSEAVRQVPPGRVITYGELARALGAPHAARAAGYALRALPESEGTPWWRVVNAAGRISPRGPGLGAEIQREMLEAEGVTFRLDGSIDLRRYGFALIS
jgi:methylated-DNA-protein-cysteine methyltransferase-like protein